MPIFSGNDDTALITERLQHWIRQKPGYGGVLVDPINAATAGTGWSNETYKVTLTRPGASAETLILRLPPVGESLLRDYDVALQYNTMKALEGIDGYPVVKGRWLETDQSFLGRPFYLMEFAEGEPAADRPIYYNSGWIAEATREERHRLWTSTVDTISRLAPIDWRARGLDVYCWPDRGRSCIEQNLEHWEGIYAWGATFFPEAPLPHIVVDLAKWLRANLPDEAEVSFNWGDARFANVIYRDFEPVALLDWELAMLGDPELDITFMLFADRHLQLLAGDGETLPQLPGFLTEAQTLERYEALRGKKVRNPNFYWLFNAYRIYGVRQRIAGLSVKWNTLTRDAALRLRKVPTLEADVRRRMDMKPSAVWEG